MSATYFIQDCPTCGRRLQIRLQYLGQVMKCRHCDGRFQATDACELPSDSGDSAILERANELLESVDAFRHRPR